MKKRFLALLLAVCILLPVFALPAAAAGSNTAVQTAVSLGALTTDQLTDLSAAVTRGEFAKMLTAFSSYRDTVRSQSEAGTLYRDVPSNSEWAPYVRVAVQNGWLYGYTDGSFRPDAVVTFEEACTAVLKLLGYTMTELTGSFPAAQINKATDLGLRSNLGRAQGEAMTREDCAVLLYNALAATNNSGSTYGSTLGFTVTDGQVDTSSVLLSNLEGPFIASEATVLPFTPSSIYRNDAVSTSAQLNAYDVYYYNESMRTLWVYTRRAAGRITAVSPSTSSPTSVTVAGTSYTIGSTSVAYQLSSLVGGGIGQVVTLLLGMDDEVVGIVTGAEANAVFYGIVQSSSRSLTENDGADVLQAVKVACTDGVTRSVYVDKSLSYPTGWLVAIHSDTENGESIEVLSNKSTSGSFNAEVTALGDYALADDVEILDTTAEGVAGTIRPSRLSNVSLSGSDVRYYTLNDKGQIDRLILDDVTGDLWEYGTLDDVKNLASVVVGLASSTDSDSSSDSTVSGVISDLADSILPSTSEVLYGILDGTITTTLWNSLTSNTGIWASFVLKRIADNTSGLLSWAFDYAGSGATYICYVNGAQTAYSTSVKYPVIAGGIAVGKGTNGSVQNMVQLMPVKVDQLGAATVRSGSDIYDTADDMQVYLWYGGQYYPTTLANVNAENYSLIGWYDNFGCAAGKKVRVLTAVRND